MGTRIHTGRGLWQRTLHFGWRHLGLLERWDSLVRSPSERSYRRGDGPEDSPFGSSGLLVGLGAGIAAPWPMPVAALLASTKAGSGNRRRWPCRLCTGLGIAAVLGQLVEPLMRQPKSWTPAVRIALLLNFGTSVGLAGAGLWQIRESRGGRPTKPV